MTFTARHCTVAGTMAGEYAFTMKDLRKVVPPKREILRGIYLSFFHGAKIGVLGANGAGKSSLLRIMAGVDDDFLGEAFPADGLRVGFLPQEPALDATKDVRGNVEEGVAETRALLTRFEEVSAKLGEPLGDDEMEKLLEEQSRLQDQIDAVNAWDLDRTVELAMDALRVPPGEAEVAKISGGERRRVALCRLLLQKPDMLLLDEPTNHLDAESVAWLERFLKEYTGTVVADHPRPLLPRQRRRLDSRARPRIRHPLGGQLLLLARPEAAAAGAGGEVRPRPPAHARSASSSGCSMSPRARQAKSKARLQAYEQMLDAPFAERAEKLEIAIPPGPRLGDLVVEADKLGKGYGDRVLIDDLSFKLPRGGIVGVIGPNGAGKTTLFRMIAGQEKPDRGTLRVGETVKLAYVDQSRETLDADKTVWQEISDGAETLDVGGRKMASRAYVASFNFKGTDQQKKVGTLSGGERNRLHLAKTLKSGGNVLLLDEPTNDLDVDTLRALEDALLEFAGCAVIISHDRWFLDRIATHMLAFEDEGKVVWFEGNYADYEADRKRRLGAEADRPHRLRYKRLPRS